MFVSLVFKKKNDVPNYVLMDSSNTKFAPVMVVKGMVDHFPMIHPRRDIPNFFTQGVHNNY